MKVNSSLKSLQKEVAELRSQLTPRVEDSNVPNRDPELAIRLPRLEEGMKAQQRALRQLQQDTVEDAKTVKQYLDQVHDMMTATLQATESLTPERAKPESTRLTKVAAEGRPSSRR